MAPSPTGHLHLGHALHLLYVCSLASRLSAAVLLRMEDHDRSRCRPAYEASILQDLHWLGCNNLVGFTGTHPDAYRQSDASPAYAAALQHLQAQGLLYGCNCSRSSIAMRQGLTNLPQQELAYDNYCRNRQLPLQPGMGVRVRLPAQPVQFVDLLLGPQQQTPAQQCGDLLLQDRHGQYTYQLCVVVDDLRQGINLIIRGEDLMASTGRQILLGQLLGRAQPAAVAHHPLLRDQLGQKLSKRTQATALQLLRQQGYSAAQVVGLAAQLAGLQAVPQPLALHQAEALLSNLPLWL